MNPAFAQISGTSGVTPSVIVSGAGTPAVDGTYTERGTNNGKPYYNLEGQPDSTTDFAIYWDGSGWVITIAGGDNQYQSFSNTLYPWQADWVGSETGGDSPGPLVTEG